MSTRLWFTRGLSHTADALSLIRATDPDRDFTLLASHTDADNRVLQEADEPFLEPSGLTGEAYATWVLHTAMARRVHVVVAQRQVAALAEAAGVFSSHGIALQVAADPTRLRLLDDKAAFYADCEARGLPVAPWRAFHTLQGFDAALAGITVGGRGRPLCLKPSHGIYGSGFHPLVAKVDHMRRLLDPDDRSLGFEEFRAILEHGPQDRPWILMEYLDGPEHSIDILATRGHMVLAVSRLKLADGRQRLALDGPEVTLAGRLVEAHRLDGIVNVQTRARAAEPGRPLILEVNARMAGGVTHAAAMGINLPGLWARQMAGSPLHLAGFDRTSSSTVYTASRAVPQSARAQEHLARQRVG